MSANPREMVSHINQEDHHTSQVIAAAQVLAIMELADAQRALDKPAIKPRVWTEGDAEPEGVTKVRDRDGDAWERQCGSWLTPTGKRSDGGYRISHSWQAMLDYYGPLTEVLP